MHTARWAGFNGLKNGRLLDAAEAGGYDVILTVDRSMQYQQNWSGRRISILVVIAKDNGVETLVKKVPEISLALNSVGEGSILLLD